MFTEKMTEDEVINVVFKGKYQNNYLDIVNLADMFINHGVLPEKFQTENGDLSIDKIMYEADNEFCVEFCDFLMSSDFQDFNLKEFIVDIFPCFWENYLKLPETKERINKRTEGD